MREVSLEPQLRLLTDLILELMQRETRLIPIRRELLDQADYSLQAVMNCLDVEKRGWVTLNDIYKFLRGFDVEVSLQNVAGLISICDNNYDGKVTFQELQWLVEGLEKSDGLYRQVVRNTDRELRDRRLSSSCTCKKGLSSNKNRNSSLRKNATEKKNRTDKKENRTDHKLRTNSKSAYREKLRERLNFEDEREKNQGGTNKQAEVKQTETVKPHEVKK